MWVILDALIGFHGNVNAGYCECIDFDFMEMSMRVIVNALEIGWNIVIFE